MWKHFAGFIFLAITFVSATFVMADEELHWGFVPSKNETPIQMEEDVEALMQKYGAYYKGNENEKTIYLTFDNGYENGYTESILNTLKKEDVKATFFLTGHYVKSATDLVQRMIDDGHTIGNHSYSHPNMANLSESAMVKEWQSFDELLASMTTAKETTFVRPPEGIYNEKLLKIGNKYGYRHIFWSVAFKDWDRNSTLPASYAYNALMSQLHPGAIILMHTVAKHNAEALPQFISDAKAKGYRFGTLDELVFENELKHLP